MEFMNDSKNKEILAISIIVLCLLAVFIGLVKKNPLNKSDNSKTQLVKSLSKDKVKVIPLEGVIYDSIVSHSPFRSTYNAAALKEELDAALSDNSVKAVLLRLNSPGGTVAASQEIYDLVFRVRKAGKPVVVSMSDVCASGCYYIASAADRIVANKGTLTGSIGVISQGLNYKGLLEKLGLKDQTFKAGKFKDLASGSNELTPEEAALMQGLLDDSYQQFLDDIHKARGISKEDLGKIAQGLIYTGKQALDVKLVDQVGTYNDAKNTVRTLLEDQGYKNYNKIVFDEIWQKNKLSGFEDLLDIGIMGKSLFKGVTGSKSQVLWQLP